MKELQKFPAKISREDKETKIQMNNVEKHIGSVNPLLNLISILVKHRNLSILGLFVFLFAGFVMVTSLTASKAHAAVSYDAASESHTGTTGSTNQASFSWTHTPVSQPEGVLIFVWNDGAASVTNSITYGGVDVPAVNGALAQDTAGETGRMRAYYKGSGLPAGAQTITLNRTNNAIEVWAVAITVQAAGDTQVYEPGIVLVEEDGTIAVQSVTDGSPGSNSVRFAGGYTGLAAPPAAGTGSTLVHNFDSGNFGGAVVRETTAGQGARNVGFSSGTADDRAYVHLAVRETPTRTISGTVYDNNESTAYTTSTAMKLSVNGGTALSTNSVGGTGAFSFSVPEPTAGDEVTIWLDTAGAGGVQGTLVFKYGASCTGTPNCTGLSVVRSQVRLQSLDGTNIIAGDMFACNNSAGTGCTDTDIGFTTGISVSTTWSTNEIKIVSGTTFAPGSAVSTQKMDVAGTYTGSAHNTTLSGSGTNTTCTASDAMPLCVSGTFTAGFGTAFTGSSSSLIKAGSYQSLTVSPGASSVTHTLQAGTFTITGTFTVGNGTLGAIVDASANNPNVTMSNLSISTNTTLQAGSGTWTISSASATPFTINGTFTANTSTFIYDAGGSKNITATTYYNLTLRPSTSTTFTLGTGASQTITVNNNYTQDAGFGQVTAATNNPNIVINGNFVFSTAGGFTASSSGTFSVGANFTVSSGVFSSNSGTVTLNTTTSATVSGSISFYRLTIATAGKTVRFTQGETFSITNRLTVSGTSGNPVVLDSTDLTGTVNWTINTTGSSSNTADYATINNSTCTVSSPTVAMSNSTGTDYGPCWSFPALITVSGTSDKTSGTVAIATGGFLRGQTGTIAGDGTWTISNVAQPSANDAVVVWVDGVADSEESTAITRYDGSGDIGSLKLITNQLSLGGTNSFGLLPEDFFYYQCGDDEDIMFFQENLTGEFISTQGCTNSYANETFYIGSVSGLTIGDGDILYTHNFVNDGAFYSTATFDASYLDITGSFTNNETVDFGSENTVQFTGTSGSHTIQIGLYVFDDVVVNGSGGTWTLTDNISVSTMNIVAGTLNAGSYNIGLGGTTSSLFSVSGTFNPGTGTVIYAGGDGIASVSIASTTYYNLEISTALGESGFAGNIVVTNNFINNDYLLSAGSYTLTVGGDFTDTGTFVAGTGTVILNDNSKSTVISGGAAPLVEYDDWDATAAFSSSATRVAQTFSYSGLTAELTQVKVRLYSSGSTGNIQAYLYNVSGSVPFSQLDASTNVIDSSTVSNGDPEWVTFNFAGYYLTDGNNYAIVIIGPADNLLEIAWDTSSPSSTGTASTYNGSSWSLQPYDLAYKVSTGRLNFYNLTSTTSGKMIRFAAGQSFGVSGALTLTGGGAGNEITITSEDESTQWFIDYTGTASVTYTYIEFAGCGYNTPVIVTSTGTVSNGSNGVCWQFPAGNITVSGTVYLSDGTTADAVGHTLYLSNGGGVAASTTSNGSGVFSFANYTAPTAGQVLTMWIEGGTYFGSLVFKYGTSCTGNPNCTGLALIRDTVSIDSKNGTSITNASLASCDEDAGLGCSTSYIGFNSDGTNLTVNDGMRLRINTGATFAPGGTVTTSVSANAASTDGDIQIISGGSLSIGANALSVGGDFSSLGTMSKSAGQTTTFTATATGHVIHNNYSTWGNVVLNGTGGGWTFGASDSNPTLDGDLTVTAGTLSGTGNLTVSGGDVTGNGTINLTGGTLTVNGAGSFGGNTAWTLNNVTLSGSSQSTTGTGSGNMNVSGVLTISAAHTLVLGASKIWVLSGTGTPLVATGTLTASTGSVVRYFGNGATIASSSNGGNSITYYYLQLMPQGATPQVLGTASGHTINVLNQLIVGDGTNAGATATTYNPVLNVSGDMSISAGATYVAGTGAMTVTGNFSNSGTVTNSASGSASFGANWDNSGTISTPSGHTTTFTATDSGNTITGTASCGVMRNIVFNGVGGSWTAPAMCGTDLTITAGTVNASSFYGASAGGAGVLNTTLGLTLQSGNLSNGGNWTVGTDLWFGDDGSTVTHNLTGAGTITIGGQFKIDSTHTVSAGNKTIILTGSGTPFVKTGTLDVSGGTSTFSYRGTSATTVATATYDNIDFSPASGTPTYTLSSGTFGVNNNFTLGGAGNPNVNANTNDPTLSISGDVTIGTGDTLVASNLNNLSVGGSWTNSGTFTHSSGTVVFNATATGKTLTPGYLSRFYNITFNGVGGGWTLIAEELGVDNVLTITNGNFNGGSGQFIDLYGSGTPFVKTGGTFTQNTSTIRYGGTSATNILALNGSGTTDAYYGLTIGNINGGVTYTMAGNTTVNSVLQVGNGGGEASTTILALGSTTLTLKDSTTPIQIQGLNKGRLDAGTSTVVFASGSGTSGLATLALTGNNQLYNMTVNGTGTFTNGLDLTVVNNLTITSGTLSATDKTVTVGGNFGGAGTFSAGTSTVVFNNAAATTVVSGSNTFNNLTIATAGKTVQFTSGTETTINGLFTVTGSSGNNVVLTSTTGSSSWTINHQGTEAITYATVSWGACNASSTSITVDVTNTNGGNNGSCWGFATYITISGSLLGNDESTPYTTSVAMKLAVGGSTSYTTSSTEGTGAFSFTNVVQPSNGDQVTIWLDTNVSGTQSTLVFKYGNGCSGGDCSGLELSLGQVKLENYHTGNLTASDFTGCHRNAGTVCTGDADLGFYIFALGSTHYISTSGWTNSELKIPTGVTFSSAILGVSKVDVEGTLISDTNYNLNSSFSGTGTNTDCSAADAMPLCVRAGGSFTPSKSIWFTGTAATLIPARTYNNLTIGPAANNVTYTLGAGTFEINGSLVFGYENWAYTGNVYDASANNPNININGDLSALSVSAFATFNAGSGTITLNGKKATLFAIGTFNAQTSTVKYAPSATANVAMVPYYNLVLDPAGENATFVLENHDRQWMEVYHVGSGDARDVIYDSERQVAYMAMSNGGINRCDYFTTSCDDQTDWPTVHTAAALMQRLFIDEANDVIYGVGNNGRIVRCDLTTGCDVTGEWSEVLNATTGLFSQMDKDTTNGYLFVGNGTNIYRCSVSTGCDAGADWSSSVFAAYDPMYSAGDGKIYATLSGDVYSCATSTGCLASENWNLVLDVTGVSGNRLSIDTTNGVIFYSTSNSTTTGAYTITIYTCHVANTGCDATGDWVVSGNITDPTTTSLHFEKFDASSGYIYGGTQGYIYRCNYTATGCNELADFEHELVFHKNASWGHEVLPDGTMFVTMVTSGAVWRGTVPTVFNQTVQNNLTVTSGATVLQGASQLSLQGNLTLDSGSTFTKGDTGKIIFSGVQSQTITDNNATKQDLGNLQSSNGNDGSTVNVAASANGGTVVSSSTINASYPETAVIDGYRYAGGSAPSWGSGGGWNDNTSGTWPDSLEITFNSTYTINEIDVFTIPDSLSSGTAPTLSDTFSSYGITEFSIDYWNGSTWVQIQNVTGNNKVWRQFTFSPVSTNKIRLVVNNGNQYSRVLEVEAWQATGIGPKLGSSIKATSLTVDSGKSFDFNGSNTLALTANSNIITNNGTLETSTGTISFQPTLATGATIPLLDYYNLDLNRSGNAFTVPNNLAVQNTFSLTAGTVTAPETMTVGGFINNGTFNHNNGTVVISPVATGVAQIGGASSLAFYNLTNTSPRTAMEFESSRTVSINGLFNVTGANGGNIWIRSSSPGVQWLLDLNGTSTINYVNVKDSGCSDSNNLTLGTKVINQGNNGSCWRLVSRGGSGGSSGSGAGSGGSGSGGGSQGGSGSAIQATATATIQSGAVNNVTITNGGSGYSQAPALCFEGGSFTQRATATATIANGIVTLISITFGGTGYQTIPSVLIVAPPGTSGTACSGSGGGSQGGGGGAGGGSP